MKALKNTPKTAKNITATKTAKKAPVKKAAKKTVKKAPVKKVLSNKEVKKAVQKHIEKTSVAKKVDARLKKEELGNVLDAALKQVTVNPEATVPAPTPVEKTAQAAVEPVKVIETPAKAPKKKAPRKYPVAYMVNITEQQRDNCVKYAEALSGKEDKKVTMAEVIRRLLQDLDAENV